MAGGERCQRRPTRRLQVPTCRQFHEIDRLFALPRRGDWASVPAALRPPPSSPSSKQGFSMTMSFPVTKTGLRLGLATALAGSLALSLIVAPARAADDANPVLAKV